MIGSGALKKYSQAMGATDANGFVVAFPFSVSATNDATVPVQVWVDSVNGDDSHNGLSPYIGYPLNGTGTNFQTGATGPNLSNPLTAYGPKKTFFAAWQGLSFVNSASRVGHQVFLVEGGAFSEGVKNLIFAPGRCGFSVQYPLCIQSYVRPTSTSDFSPLDTSKHGRAVSPNRPTMKQNAQVAQFNGSISGNTLQIDNLRGGDFTASFSSTIMSIVTQPTVGQLTYNYPINGTPLPCLIQNIQSVSAGIVTAWQTSSNQGTLATAPYSIAVNMQVGQTLTSASVLADTVVRQFLGVTGQAVLNKAGASITGATLLSGIAGSDSIPTDMVVGDSGQIVAGIYFVAGSTWAPDTKNVGIADTVANYLAVLDAWQQGCYATGVSSGTTSLAVSSIGGLLAGIPAGAAVIGPGVPAGTVIVSGPSNGAAGTYTTNNATTCNGKLVFVLNPSVVTAGKLVINADINSGTALNFWVSGAIYKLGLGDSSKNTYFHRVNKAQTVATEAMSATGVCDPPLVFSGGSTANPTSPIPFGNIAVRGIDFVSTSWPDGCSVGTGTSNAYNVLFENCLCVNLGCGSGSSAADGRMQNVIFRKCSTSGAYASDGAHSAGLGTGHINLLVVEDCVVNHGGWPMGKNRQESIFMATTSGNTLTIQSTSQSGLEVGQAISKGLSNTCYITGQIDATHWTYNGPPQTVSVSTQFVTVHNWSPDIFKQNHYASYGANDQSIIRRSVYVDGAASGLSARAGIHFYHSIMIDNAVQAVAGGSVNSATGGYSTETPSGCDINYHHNLIMGGADINAANIRGQGIYVQNGRPNSKCHHMLFINNPEYNNGLDCALTNSAAFNVPSYMEANNNILYDYSPNFLQPVSQMGGGTQPFPAQWFMTIDGVAVSLSNPNGSLGSNVNNLTSSPHTNTDIYTALGVLGYGSGDKTSLIAAMVANPDQPWAERILAQVGTMFSFDFALNALDAV